MPKAKKSAKKSAKKARKAVARAGGNGSYILLNNAQKKQVLDDLLAIADQASGTDLETKIRAVHVTLHDATFSGQIHTFKK